MRRSDLRDSNLLGEPSLDVEAPRVMTRMQRALARVQEDENVDKPKRPYNLRPIRFQPGDRVRVKLPEQRRAALDNKTK